MNTPARIAVFASGSGTNLQALLAHFNQGRSPVARVELVIGGRAGIGALARADAAGVPWIVVDAAGASSAEEVASSMFTALADHRIDLIVLAGYLKLVPAAVVGRFSGRMLNIHPALLPAFGGPGMYGMRVHRAVVESGARVTGATVHVVGERYDEGPIVAQWPVPVWPGDTPEVVAARVLRVEHLLLPAAVESHLRREGEREVAAASAADGDMAGPEPATSFELFEGVAPKSDSVWRLNH